MIPLLAVAPRRRERGFTLLELCVVLLLFGIVISFAMPRFGDQASRELDSHVRRLATKCRFLHNEAILNGRIYRLHFDLDQHRYWIDAETDSGELDDSLGSTLSQPVALPDTVAFSDVVLQGVGKAEQGQVYMRFFPDGTADPTVIHMDNGRQAYTLVVWPFTSKIGRYEGYRDVLPLGS